MNEKNAYSMLMERLEFPNSTRLRSIMEEMMTPEPEQAQMAWAG